MAQKEWGYSAQPTAPWMFPLTCTKMGNECCAAGGFSKCAAPAELFFIERGCLSKTEIGEREICMHLRICRTRTVARASPSPPTRDKRKAGPVYPASPPPPPTHSPWPKLVIFRDCGQKGRRPLFRGLKVIQLNSDSFCDYVRI